MHRLYHAATALLLVVAATLPASAASLTTADQHEIQDYTLSREFLESAIDVSREAKRQHLSPKLDIANAHSLDAMASQLNAKPGVRALLAKHDLTAHEYLVGSFALMRASMTAMRRSNPGQAKHIDPDRINEANVKFYQAHKAQVNEFFSGASEK